MARLDEPEIRERVKALHGWRYADGFIVKTFRFKTFMAGIRFVNEIAEIAERIDHHPDIHVVWTAVRLQVQSHDEGGITPRDFRLAGEIEAFLQRGRRHAHHTTRYR